MIRFEDLMAARWLYQKFPEQRVLYLAALETLRDTPPDQRTLLGNLVAREVITAEQAHYVHSEVDRYTRGRGIAIYGHLLAREGMPADQVRALLDRLGPDSDLNTLGDVIVAQGRIHPTREHQLRFQARLSLDRDMAGQVERHLQSHPGRNVSLSSSGGEERTVLGSSVIRGFAAERAALPVPEAEEARKIVEGTLSDADDELPGPLFRIPDWVDMSHARVGKQLAGYRILGMVGAGAMGEVYLVDSRDQPEKPIALKLLPPNASDDMRGRFKREILANSFFAHPGALEVYDAGQTDRGYHYLAMEFFDGRDLEKILDETKRLPAAKAVEIARQCFETLAASHAANVVHRDVKPGNILVSWEGDVAKLMDFGIAIIGDLNEFQDRVFTSMEGAITGTPEFMSPEQAGGEPLTASSDDYSMGVALYQMLSGRLPFESETSGGFITCHMIEEPLPLREADPSCANLPHELVDLVMQLLAKTPADRPESSAVAQRLAEIQPKLTERPSGRLFSFLGWRKR